MNWINFLSYTGMCYAVYYLVLIFRDQKLSRTMEASREPPKLVFEDTQPPVVVAPVSTKRDTKATPATVGLGGVKMQDFFALAKTEALQYTRPISF